MLDAILDGHRDARCVDAPACVGGRVGRRGTAGRTGSARTLRDASSAGRPRRRRSDDPARAGDVRRAGAPRTVARARAGRPRRRSSSGPRALAPEHRDELARLIALRAGQAAQGRPRRDGPRRRTRSRSAPPRPGRSAARCCRSPGWARGVGNTALTYRAPAGVALAITPFNAPANLLAHKLGASFAAGNTTIVKAPPQAPGDARRPSSRCCSRPGMPAEAVQLLHGGGEVGAALCAAPEVGVISFTGSAATGARRRPRGRRQAARARARRQRRDHRVRGRRHRRTPRAVCARTGYSQLRAELHLGAAGLRPPRSVSTTSSTRFAPRSATLVVGDPLDPATDVGSMVDDDGRRARRVLGRARPSPAGAAARPRRRRATARPLQPTVVADPPADATVVADEVFGALVAVLPYDDFDDVIDACNDSRYGLQAGLFTRDIGRDRSTAWRELAGRRPDRQRLVELPPRPRAVRRGEGLRLRPGVARADDRGLHASSRR